MKIGDLVSHIVITFTMAVKNSETSSSLRVPDLY